MTELTAGQIAARVNKLAQQNSRYFSLVQLCREMYEMKKEYTSNWLGSGANQWRSEVPAEYWRPSSKPHNVIDLVTAILGGHKPQLQALTPGTQNAYVQNRTEKFVQGVFQLNSRRTGEDFLRQMIFRAALDGQVAVRVIWMPSAPQPNVQIVPHPDSPQEQVTLGTFDYNEFPISIEVIPIDQVYYEGRGPFGMPYRALYHVRELTEHEMVSEWGAVEEAQQGVKNGLRDNHNPNTSQKFKLIEYWEYNEQREVVHAVVWKQQYLIEPHPVSSYKYIPYVIAKFKPYDTNTSDLPAIPFLYPILNDATKAEYMASRTFRMVDMLTGIPPLKRGDGPPINVNGTWGKVQNLKPGEDIVFPKAPGFGPDLYQVIQDLKNSMSEGTFSEATFGAVGQGISGYSLSQMLGADTTRTDTPKANMELALGQIIDILLSILQTITPHIYLSVLCEDKGRATSAMLMGDETKGIQVMVKMRLKSTQDDVRRNSIGAQISSMPGLPLSKAHILETFFDIAQPEEEMERKRAEDAMNSPTIQLMAMLQAVSETDYPLKELIIAELTKQLQGLLGGGQQASGPQPSITMPGMGMGTPQTAMGTDNIPMMNPGENPQAPGPGASVGGLQPMQPQGGPT